MIDIKKLTEKDIGRWVGLRISWPNGITQLGKIKGWNNSFIFVVYNCDNEWHRFQEFTANATSPDELFFIDETTRTT